jgi:phospholipase C
MSIVRNLGFGIALAAGATLAACGANMGSPPNPQYAREILSSSSSGLSKIKHVVIIIQENRSFNNLFMDYPGAKTRKYGYLSSGKKVTLEPIPLEADDLPGYSLQAFLTQCDGTGSIPGTDCRMDGFNKVAWTCPPSNKCLFPYVPYAYVPQTETAIYWNLAKQYVLADQMYASNLDESSFISHQYIIAAQAMKAFNWPDSSDWGCEGGSCGRLLGVLFGSRRPARRRGRLERISGQ